MENYYHQLGFWCNTLIGFGLLRFTQPAYSTSHFSNKVWVKCPQCSEPGLVRTNSDKVKSVIPTGINPASYTCSNCDLDLTEKLKWFGFYQGTISRPCGFCGVPIFRQIKPTRTPPESVSVTCESCEKEREYEVNWRKSLNDWTIDPHFGMDLLIHISIKSNTLWFYNIDHLRYIRDYVQAKIRDDNNRHKYSLISNLPQWILAAKNRDIIVKKVTKLEKEVSNKIATLSL